MSSGYTREWSVCSVCFAGLAAYIAAWSMAGTLGLAVDGRRQHYFPAVHDETWLRLKFAEVTLCSAVSHFLTLTTPQEQRVTSGGLRG